MPAWLCVPDNPEKVCDSNAAALMDCSVRIDLTGITAGL